MRIELGLILKYVSGAAHNVYAVNYFTKPLQRQKSITMKKMHMKLIFRWVIQSNSQGSSLDNWRQGQRNQIRDYGNYNREGQYF